MTISSGSSFQSLSMKKWNHDKDVVCGLNILKQWSLVMDNDQKVNNDAGYMSNKLWTSKLGYL